MDMNNINENEEKNFCVLFHKKIMKYNTFSRLNS